jgi:hypothetical protein
MRLRPISLGFLLLLGGCDAIYGIQSRLALPAPVDVGCVHAALLAIPEAGPVSYERDEARSTEILPKQRKVLTVMHVWLYGGGAILQMNETPDGWEFSNGRTRMGVEVPREELLRFVPLMQEANRSLQARCGLPVADLQAEPVGETKRDWRRSATGR